MGQDLAGFYTPHLVERLREVGRRYQSARRLYERGFYPTAIIGEILARPASRPRALECGLAPVSC